MKRKIGLFFVVAVSAICIAFGAAACASDSNDKNNNDEDKVIDVVPTYHGMTISRDNAEVAAANTMSAAMTKEKPGNSGNGGDNGYNPWEDRPGWNPGDGNPHYDYDNEDKEEPEEAIEDIVDIDVVEDSEVRYYVDPGETFIIEVHLSNPSNYIIQSFTLNGKIYANYMFEDDSTLELLRLEVVAPAIPGYTEYTIDAIKYIDSNDNNAIKDAAFEGDRSVSAGVKYTAEPVATISGLKVGTTTADMIVTLDDSQDVLGDAPANFYLTKDDEVVYTSLLKEGINNLSFDGLLMGQTYQYGVGTYYDLVDGNGVRAHWLNTGSFATQKPYSFDNVAIYKTQVEFSVSKIGDNGTIKSIELIDAADEKIVSSLSDFTKTWFTGLLSNHEYKIKLSFSYESAGQAIEDSTAISFVTGAKTAPALELENVTADKDSVSFTTAITDTDGILEIKSVNLINDGKLVQSLEDLTMRKFEGLLSDAEYELVVNYSYDLNDGTGEHSATASTTVKTLAKAVPSVSIGGITATQTDISFDISTVDTDNTLTIGAIVLSNKRGDIIQIKDMAVLVASGLLSDTEYEIKVNYTYDLNDGNGEHNMAVTANGKTLAKVASSVEIENVAITQTDVSFELETVDRDNILTIDSVILSNEAGKVAELTSLDELSFGGLLSGNEYTITVNYSYNLNNGNGVQKANVTATAKTLAKVAPSVEIENVATTQTDISFELATVDKDNILTIESVVLSSEEENVAELENFDELSFSGLLSDNEYTITVNYSYDLNNGKGAQNTTVTATAKTLAKVAPIIYADFSDVQTDSLTGTVTFIDDDLVGKVTSTGLYKGNDLVASVEDYSEFTVGGLSTYTLYELRVEYSYDLNNGNGIKNNVAIFEITTLPSVAITSFNVMNVEPVVDGDVIYINRALNNPYNLTIQSFVINDYEYEVNSVSGDDKYYVNITNDGQFAGGLTELTVNYIIASLDGKEYKLIPEIDATEGQLNNEVFINGSISLETVEFVDDDYNITEVAYVGETYYLKLTFDNSTGYTINSLYVDGLPVTDGIVMAENGDSNIWFVPYSDISSGVNDIYVGNISYGNDTYGGTIETEVMLSGIIGITVSEPVVVSDYNDLLDMSEYRVYELACDIDLSGMQWIGGTFNGILLGNGHTISNISYISSKTEYTDFGLFANGCGIISIIGF